MKKLLIPAGTARCGVPARVQRAEYKVFVNHFTKPLRRCLGVRTAQRTVPVFFDKTQSQQAKKKH
jgi:hypothetical protein